MKTYKEITENRKYQDKLICDICKKESNGKYLGDWETENPDSYYDWQHDITIKHYYSYHYPYDGGGEGYDLEVDLCPDCFSQVLDFIKSKGAEVKYVHSEC